MQNQQNQKNQNNSYRVIAPPPLKSYSPEWFLSKYLGGWTQEDMEIAIKKNFQWDLSKWRNTIIEHFVGWFLDWAKIHRPDLYKPLSTVDGKKWLKTNIQEAMTQTS